MRKWRKSAKLTLKDLAPKVGLSESSLSGAEGGEIAPKQDHAEAIDEALQVEGRLMLSWVNRNNEGLVPAGFRKTVDLERDALELRFYNPILIPGLIQAADYARALFVADLPQADEARLNALVEQRLQRQQVFNRPERPIVCVVLDESVLRRVVGGPSVMAAQLGQIASLVEKRWIQCQVLPSNAASQPELAGGFRVMVLEMQTFVAAEHAFDEVLIDESDQDLVRRATSVYGRLHGETLSPYDSLNMIRELEQNRSMMSDHRPTKSSHRPFHKSSYSGSSGAECVEVSEGETVLVRDTQHRELGHLTFTPSAWDSFLSDLKQGRLRL